MAHIILITQWTGGDVRPFLRLGTYLKAEGHKITLLTHCIYESEATELGFEFCAIDSPAEYESISRDLHLLADPIGGRDDYLAFHRKYHGKERLLREVGLVEEILRKNGLTENDLRQEAAKTDVMVIARFRSGISGMLAAEKYHLRYASMILAPNYFSHMELHEELFGEALCEEINSAREALSLPPINHWKNWLYSPKVILCGWPEWYAKRDETWAEGAYPIGFLADPEGEVAHPAGFRRGSGEDRSKTDTQNCVVITGGSSRMVRKDFYLTAIEACALTDRKGIVVTPFRDYLPEVLPENITHMANVPLTSLLSEASLVIHHGGMGTINEAIDAGIPQIILPHLTDGPDNADRLVSLGIGRKFAPKNWDPAVIADTIREMSGSESLKDHCEEIRRQNLESFRAQSRKEAIEAAEVYRLPEELLSDQTQQKSEATSASDHTGDPAAPSAPRKAVSKQMLMQMVKRNRQKAEA